MISIRRSLMICFVAIALMATTMVSPAKAQKMSYNVQKAYDMLSKGEDLEDAMKLLNEELRSNRQNSNAYFMRGLIYLEREKYGQEIIEISNAIKCYSGKDAIWGPHILYWFRARAYTHVNMYDEAIKDYNMALSIAEKLKSKKDITDILFEQGLIYHIHGDYVAAEKAYQKCLKIDPMSAGGMVGLARSRMREKKYQEALSLLDKCILYYPDYDEPYRFRTLAYDEMGETHNAIDNAIVYLGLTTNSQTNFLIPIFKKDLRYTLSKINEKEKQDSERKSYWAALKATVYTWQGDYGRAVKQYERMEKEFGQAPYVTLKKAEAYNELGKVNDAVREISKLIADCEDDDCFYYYAERADIYREAGMYEEAIKDFDSAMEYDAMSCYPYYKMGWCYEFLGNEKKAMQLYNEGIEIENDYAYIYLNRGRLYDKMGEKTLAEADFNRILEIDTVPKSGSCRQYALVFLGWKTEAEEWMDKIVATDEYDCGVRYDQACLLGRVGKIQESMEALKKAVALGYSHIAHIEHDEDMDVLRELPDFKALMEELKEKLQNNE